MAAGLSTLFPGIEKYPIAFNTDYNVRMGLAELPPPPPLPKRVGGYIIKATILPDPFFPGEAHYDYAG